MELTYKGGNCVVVGGKQTTLVIDDNLKQLGLTPVKKANVTLCTNHELLKCEAIPEAFVIDGPGEFEIDGASIKGIAAQAHTDEAKTHNATIYTVTTGGVKLAILGHIHPNLSDEDLEAIGTVDVLVIPVGGHGYTLDAVGAAKLVRAIEPKAVVPTHYADKAIKYEVPQAELADFLKELGSTGEQTDKLKIKNGQLPENLTVYVLARN